MRNALLLASLIGIGITTGCSETVAFLSLDIDAPSWTPEITCDGDPRRPTELTVAVSCDGGSRSEARYALGEVTTVALSGGAMGACRVDVTGHNAHERTVVRGSLLTEILTGENTPLRIELLQEPCAEGCDSDGDGLADSDEEALGLDPRHPDSDHDGLDDGLELVRCCSDPREPGRECQLLIDKVLPPLGVAGAPVMVKATAELQSPEVSLGQAPLEAPIADTSTVFGRVADRAVLGPVVLASGGAKQQHTALFAVLQAPPTPVYELDQKAGAKSGLLQEVVDLVTLPSATFLLGSSARSGDASAASAEGQAVLVTIDRKTDKHSRARIPGKGAPQALAITEGRLAVLLRHPGGGSLVLLGGTPSTDSAAGDPASKTISLSEPPVSALFSGGGQGMLVLNDDSVTLVDLKSDKATTTALPEILGKIQVPAADGVKPALTNNRAGVRCTGMAVDINRDRLFIACNINAPCRDASGCPGTPGRGVLLRLGPLDKCFAGRTDNVSAALVAGCWSMHPTPGPQRVFGPPVIDSQAKRAYALTGAGVMAAPLADGPLLSPLEPVIPFSLEGLLPSLPRANARVMVGDAAGRLYVATGPVVRRLEPRASQVDKRYGLPFPVSQVDSETAQLLSIDPAGTALEVTRRQAATSLMTVCLQRCPECACR